MSYIKNYIKPTSDIFVKYLFGSDENKDLLLSFINAVLKNSGFTLIKSVELKNPFNPKKLNFDKETILDIKATDEFGKIFNIEIQTSGSNIFKHRTLYYWAKLYSSQLQEGEQYKSLYPVICINILDFTLFNDFKKYHSTFMVLDKDDPEFALTEHLVIHFLELSKLPDLIDFKMQKKLEIWLYYLKNEGREDEKMKTLLNENTDIQRAHEKYIAFTKDEELIDAYEAHMKWKRDYNTGISNAREKGREEGREKGREEGREKGREEGREKGREEEAKDMLIEAIEAKFGFIHKDIKLKIISIKSTKVIRSLLRSTYKIDTLEDFDRLIGSA